LEAAAFPLHSRFGNSPVKSKLVPFDIIESGGQVGQGVHAAHSQEFEHLEQK
jgi:hypothetical protein